MREVPVVEEDEDDVGPLTEGGSRGNSAEGESAEQGLKATVGLTVGKKSKAGGLGKLKDYSKRKKEVPNPYAPAQVSGCLKAKS